MTKITTVAMLNRLANKVDGFAMGKVADAVSNPNDEEYRDEFRIGFTLGVKATKSGKGVFRVRHDALWEEFFFIGSLSAVKKKLEHLVKSHPRPEDQ